MSTAELTTKPARLIELDALRGLAAMSVVFCHVLHIFPQTGPYAAVNAVVEGAARTPLALLFAGHEAVVLFFILSGFVLSLPCLDGKPLNYGSYLIRRVFRIYVPYLCSVVGAVVVSALCYGGRIPDLSDWFNRAWSGPASASSVLDHATFLGFFANAQLNPVYWSLVHEMRVSLMFPFVALVLLRLKWTWGLGLAVAISFASVVLNKLAGAGTDYFYSFHYLAFFMVGHVIARHRDALRTQYERRSALTVWCVALLGVGFYCYGKFMKLIVLQDWTIAAGASVFVVLSLHSPPVKRLLNLGPVRFLGEISYSLYLWHAVVLLAAIHLLYGALPLGWILGIVLAASWLLAAASHRWIELPAIRAGKSVGRIWDRRTRGRWAGGPAGDDVLVNATDSAWKAENSGRSA